MNNRNNCLRSLCRSYLIKLRYMARKHGLGDWLEEAIEDTRKRGDCEPTEKECEMLSRLVNEERLQRTDVPTILGLTYRDCVENNEFDKIKKLPRQGIYSKVSTLLYASKKQSN